MGYKQAGRQCRIWCAAVLVHLLVACGGGGGAPEPSVEPVKLPASLSVSLPGTRQALNTDVAFSSSVVDPGRTLRYRWEFGDGTSSTEATPQHRYVRSGSYTVVLTLTDEAGASMQASHVVTVADLALVQGLACSGADSGGWCWQNPLPQGNLILDQAWVDERIGWAVGQAGAILKTTDGGLQWVVQSTRLLVPLTRVIAVSAQVAWIGGEGGLVLVTSDGGASWRAGSVGTSVDMAGLQALDANSAWISGYGDAWSTNDGGQTWRTLTRPDNGYLTLQQTSPTQAWASGLDSQVRWQLLSTHDAGASWQAVALPAPASSASQNEFRFVSAQYGYIRSTGWVYDGATYVYRTTLHYTADGGITWRVGIPNPSQQAGYNDELLLAPDGSLFARASFGATYESSADGGQTWANFPLPDLAGGYVIKLTPYSATRAVVRASVGGVARQYVTTDGGIQWQVPKAPDGGDASAINSLWFFDGREGIAFTDAGGSLRTTDGGRTWTPRSAPVQPSYGWGKVEFSADGSAGWAISSTGEVLRSTDRGQTWLVPAPQSSERMSGTVDVHFIDAYKGWALAPWSWTGVSQLFTTGNGGMSWEAVPSATNLGSMRALRFASASQGVAVGSAGVAMVTGDGGLSWRARPTGSTRDMNDVVFIDAQTAVAVGRAGTILRSTDRGETWMRVPGASAEDLTHVRFASAEVGHATGAGGAVLVTRDGGISWTNIAAPTSFAMAGSFFIDADTGWVVGQNGAILVTVSGGR